MTMATAVGNYHHQTSPSGLCNIATNNNNNKTNIRQQTKKNEQRMNQSDYSISFDDQQHQSNDHIYQQDVIVNRTTSTILPDYSNDVQMFSSARSVPNLSMAPFSTRPPPPPTSFHHLPPSFGTNRIINLKTMLDIFQSAISQRQAWALLHQALKSLKCLMLAPNQVSLLRELDSFEQFSLDMQGNVTTSTWLGEVDQIHRKHSLRSFSRSSSQGSLPFADEETEDDGIRVRSRILSTTTINRDPKRIQSAINIILSSLAKIIYSALSQTFADDEEPDLDEDLEDLLGYMIKLDNVADHVGSTLPLKKLNNTDNDEGVGEDEEDDYFVYAIQIVLEKCEEYFYYQYTKLKNNETSHKMSDVCPIMEMLVQQQTTTGTPISADLYFQTVCSLMVDEAFKLYKLLDQLCDIHSNDSKSKAGPSISSCSMGNLHSRHKVAEESVDTENLKQWAQTWIKVMSELRFGVHLHPVSPDHHKEKQISPAEEFQTSIQTKRNNLRKVEQIDLNKTIHLPISHGGDMTRSIGGCRRHLSLPSITEKMIVQKLKSLRPAMERNLSQLPPSKPCLHDSLMTEIRSSNVHLRPTKTVVKSNITQLYLEERRRRGYLRNLYFPFYSTFFSKYYQLIKKF